MKAEDIGKKYEKKYGHKSAASGRFQRHVGVTPTGILSLDYALGKGGWEDGSIIEVFGPPDIGKSSIIGFNGIVEAQKMGKMCAIVAVEPGFDPGWAEKNGVDLDQLVIGWPDDGEEAFNMLFDFVYDDDIQFILFDSIGALLRPAEAGDKGKPSVGGQSALITWGVKRIQTPVWKRKKTVILLNQIRDDMNARIPGMVNSPGGHALEHTAEIRVQLKPGKDRYKVKIDGDDVEYGRSIVALIIRTKKDEGTKKRAVFDHYSMAAEGHEIGVDKTSDILNTAKRTGTIRTGGAWYYHANFPDGKLMGKESVQEFFENNPATVETIRTEVLNAMKKSQVPDPQMTLEETQGEVDGEANSK